MATGAFICGCRGLQLTADEIGFLRDADPWGLILFKRNIDSPAQVLALTDHFRSICGRDNAPVLVDQEGGRVQRLGPPHWPRYPAARRFGELYADDPLAALASARRIARLMAADLEAVGITVDCLPVADVAQPGSHGIIGDRAYGTRPEAIALLAGAVMAGLMEGGVLPVVKHVPGHGRAVVDSHIELPVVDASVDDLARTDFLPFAALVSAPMAMTAHVVYSAIDDSAPATLSRHVVQSVIREAIGFDGLLMSDDLSMRALTGPIGARARAAIAAGCDLVLHCNGDLAEMEEVAAAAGDLTGRSLERAGEALGRLRTPRALDHIEARRELERLTSSI